MTEQEQKEREAFVDEVALEIAINTAFAGLPMGSHPRVLVRAAVEAYESARTQQAAVPDEWADKPDEYSAEIESSLSYAERDHDLYTKAFNLVSNRHSKFALVHLVYWLLKKATPAQPDKAEVVVHRVIEENGQDYAVLSVTELTRLQALAALPPQRDDSGMVEELERLGTSPTTGRKRGWVMLVDVLSIVRAAQAKTGA